MMPSRYIPPPLRAGMETKISDPPASSIQPRRKIRNFDIWYPSKEIRRRSYPPIKVPPTVSPPIVRRTSPDISDRSLIAGPLLPQKTNSLLKALGHEEIIISDEHLAALAHQPLTGSPKIEPSDLVGADNFLSWVQIYLPILIYLYDQFITNTHTISFATYATLTYQFILKSASQH